MRSSFSAPTRRDRAVAFAVYVFVLTAAYYYNLTFVQLGLTEVGLEQLGLVPELVAVGMGLLALVTLGTTLLSGYLMDRLGLGTAVQAKFRVLFGVVLLQMPVTYAVTAVTSFGGFLVWICVCSLLLGTAIPFAFSLLADLVAPEIRGYAAGAVAGAAFFLAALFPFTWEIERFVLSAILVLAPAALVLGALSVPGLDSRFEYRAHTAGRTAGPAGPSGVVNTGFLAGVVLLFGAFFVDSFGFVRIIEDPTYVEALWQSPDPDTRLLIAVTHVAGGVVAGIVYVKLRHVWLLAGSFALFAAAQVLYVFDIVSGGPTALATATTLVYVVAVSCYTTVAFALWPDLATPERVGRYTGVGIGIGGWLATFTSTALALVSEQAQTPLALHLSVVGLTSLGFLVVAALVLRARR